MIAVRRVERQLRGVIVQDELACDAVDGVAVKAQGDDELLAGADGGIGRGQAEIRRGGGGRGGSHREGGRSHRETTSLRMHEGIPGCEHKPIKYGRMAHTYILRAEPVTSLGWVKSRQLPVCKFSLLEHSEAWDRSARIG
jgi:hypothetical protein